MTILLFFNDTKKIVINENSNNIFTRGIVNVLLEPYFETEGIHLTYDDISSIIINDYSCKIIQNSFPIGLKKLEINRSVLDTIPIFPLTIEQIIIRESNIILNEDFTKYPNLKHLHLMVNSIIYGIYPDNIYKIIKNKNKSNTTYYNPVPLRIQVPQDTNMAHLVNNSQSVHISSINKSICDSIIIINKLADEYPVVENPLDILINSEKNYSIIYSIINKLFNNTKSNSLKENIKFWLDCNDKHSLHQITFSTLFEKVIRIIINHEHKEDLLERLRTELQESIGLCFTGRMNRTVNSLVGFIDGVKVSFSIEEQIQLESSEIIKRLNSKTITFEQATLEMLNIFNDEEIKNDTRLIQLKDAYIDALNDLKED